MNTIKEYVFSSIGQKQIVAATGFTLISFVVVHLAGNFFIYLGADAFNSYARKLASLRPGLYILEAILFILFVIHMICTALLVIENRRARSINYTGQPTAQTRSRSWPTRLMPFTGVVILVFVGIHLKDFTFADHTTSLGLYGSVVTAFRSPLHASFYILAMFCLGSHLVHGFMSFFQTFGIYHERYTPIVKKISVLFGFAIALGYSSIPVYVLIKFGTR